MNKIKNLIKGSSVAMIVAGLLVAGVASAALVSHLSNSVKATATVTSPVEMSVNEDRDGTTVGNESIDVDTTGGSDFTFTTVAKNNANNAIEGFPVIVVKASDGGKLTGKELTKVMFEDKNSATDGAPMGPDGVHKAWDITGLLYVVEGNGSLTKLSSKTWDNEKLVIFFDNSGTGVPPVDGYPLAAGEVNWNVLTITLSPSVIGTYNVYSQYAANLAEYATGQYE